MPPFMEFGRMNRRRPWSMTRYMASAESRIGITFTAPWNPKNGTTNTPESRMHRITPMNDQFQCPWMRSSSRIDPSDSSGSSAQASP